MPPDPRVHVGVVAVVELAGDLLMVRRGGVGPYAGDGYGKWALPGGWIDFGETPRETAVREAYEETGVTVEAIAEQGWVNCVSDPDALGHNAPPFQIVTLFVRCRYVAGISRIMEPEKCPEVEWVPVREVKDRELFAPLEAWWPKGCWTLGAEPPPTEALR